MWRNVRDLVNWQTAHFSGRHRHLALKKMLPQQCVSSLNGYRRGPQLPCPGSPRPQNPRPCPSRLTRWPAANGRPAILPRRTNPKPMLELRKRTGKKPLQCKRPNYFQVDSSHCFPLSLSLYTSFCRVKQRRAPSSTNQRALAARRNFMKLAKDGPPARSSLTMFDLIFYNPVTNPM